MSTKPILETPFGGENCEEYNALWNALIHCATDFGQDIYTYLETTPKTSLVVELVSTLHEMGYHVVKNDNVKYVHIHPSAE